MKNSPVTLSSSNLSPRTIKLLLSSLADEIASAIARGENITIPGIGTFSAKEMKPKTTSNLVVGTGKSMGEHTSPARKKMKFKADPALIKKINAETPAGGLQVVR